MLLHGLASQRHYWNLVLPGLGGLPVLALDARGHGDSERPDSGYDTGTVAADLHTALDALGWSRAVVVGHSWGAMVALTFAAAHPERALAVVAVDGGFSRPGGDRGDLDGPERAGSDGPERAGSDGPERTGGERPDRAVLRERLAPPRLAVPPDQLERTLAAGPLAALWSPEVAAAVLPIFETGPDGLARARFPYEAHMQVVDALLDYDPAATLAAVRCPTWLVSCEPVDAGDVGSGDVGSGDVGSGDVGSGDVGSGDVGPGDVGSGDVGSGDVVEDGEGRRWAREKAAGLAVAARVAAAPRLMRWAGAVHDVPLQWPALVAGLVRAAVADAARQ